MKLLHIISLAYLGTALSSTALGVVALSNRNDIYNTMQATICGSEKIYTEPADIWGLNIFDAQISGRIYKNQQPKIPIKESVIQRDSINANKGYVHNGYSSGHCPNGNAWLITVPSSKPLIRLSKSEYLIDGEELARQCKSVRIDYAGAKKGTARKINFPFEQKNPKLKLDFSLLGDGIFSVTCTPIKQSWAGPVLLYLAPVKNGPDFDVPFDKFLKSTFATSSSLVVWINNIRRKEGLEPLAFNEQILADSARSLAAQKNVTHNKTMLKQINDKMHSSKIQFLGEDRVKSHSFENMAWLLWNSPRHRELILNKDATHGGIYYEGQNGLKFAVLVLGKSIVK